HDSDINCIQISRDGALLGTGGNDKKLILYDSKTGACVASATLVGCNQAVMCVSFNATSDHVLGTSNDNAHTLTGHIGKVYAARFTDSNRVISGSHDRTIKLWDLAKGYCIKTIFTLSSCNDLISLDGDGTVIVSGHLDNNLRIWDTRSGNLVKEVTGIHSGQITGVEASPSSPDGQYVASGSADGALYFWNAAQGRVEKVLREHRSPVCGVVWNPNGGSSVCSADKDKTIVVW
ncbi:WD40-repeat-containing domain protein, partial [Blyttiomyces helicus]